jgi:hypothetical protein
MTPRKIELALLEEEEQSQAAVGVSDDSSARAGWLRRPMSTRIDGLWAFCVYLVSFRVTITGTSLIPVRFDPGRSCEFKSVLLLA